MDYKPKIITGRVHDTGWPIDGHVLSFGLWAYDNHSCWHLYGWEDADDEAVMLTMYQSEKEIGECLHDTPEAFAEAWKAGDWEPMGVFCVDLDKVEVVEVIQEEENGEEYTARIELTPRKESDRGGFLCLPLAEHLGDDVKAKHPEWELMDCPKCGRKCWKPAGVEELQKKQGVRLLCTACALETGTAAPYHRDNTPKPGGNRAQRRRAKRGK